MARMYISHRMTMERLAYGVFAPMGPNGLNHSSWSHWPGLLRRQTASGCTLFVRALRFHSSVEACRMEQPRRYFALLVARPFSTTLHPQMDSSIWRYRAIPSHARRFSKLILAPGPPWWQFA